MIMLFAAPLALGSLGRRQYQGFDYTKAKRWATMCELKYWSICNVVSQKYAFPGDDHR